jgi:hypothetical protein
MHRRQKHATFIDRRDVVGLAVGLAVLSCFAPQAAAAGKPDVQFIETPKDLAAWSRNARRYLLKWYPQIANYLRPSTRPRLPDLKVAVVEYDKFIAFVKDDTIIVSAPFVRSHPGDLGMLAHEAVHVVQAYPKHKDVWVSEGIADYIRYFVVEPGSPHAAFEIASDTYRRGYQPAAALLNWLMATQNPQTVFLLDKLLSSDRYHEKFWKKTFGKTADQLWSEFKASQA